MIKLAWQSHIGTQCRHGIVGRAGGGIVFGNILNFGGVGLQNCRVF